MKTSTGIVIGICFLVLVGIKFCSKRDLLPLVTTDMGGQQSVQSVEPEPLWSIERVRTFYHPKKEYPFRARKDKFSKVFDFGSGVYVWIAPVIPGNPKLWVRTADNKEDLKYASPRLMTVDEFNFYKFDSRAIQDFMLWKNDENESIKLVIFYRRKT